MSYKTSDQCAPLAALRVDVDAEASAAHPTMQAVVRDACNHHNAAIDLMTGEGAFADAWEPAALDEDGNPIRLAHDPGAFAVPLDGICIELRSKQAPTSYPDADLIRHRVGLVANIDAGHPVAKHWRVLQFRCYPPGQVQAWPEIEALAG